MAIRRLVIHTGFLPIPLELPSQDQVFQLYQSSITTLPLNLSFEIERKSKFEGSYPGVASLGSFISFRTCT